MASIEFPDGSKFPSSVRNGGKPPKSLRKIAELRVKAAKPTKASFKKLTDAFYAKEKERLSHIGKLPGEKGFIDPKLRKDLGNRGKLVSEIPASPTN